MSEKENKAVESVPPVVDENFIKDDNIYIYGVFDDTIMKGILPYLIKRVDEVKKLKEGKIKFYIDSNGGYVDVLKNLLTQIEIAKANGVIIETYVMAKAYSCGSILACAGTKGHRYISPYAEHLPHLGQTNSGPVVNDTELERMSDRMQGHFDFIRNAYKKYANIKNLNSVIKNDCYWIRGEKIIENGLADKMLF